MKVFLRFSYKYITIFVEMFIFIPSIHLFKKIFEHFLIIQFFATFFGFEGSDSTFRIFLIFSYFTFVLAVSYNGSLQLSSQS